MKNLKLILIVLLTAAMLFAVSCVTTDPCVHADTDGDKNCDNCGAAYEAPKCTTCVDNNSDEKCDVCGSPVEKQTCTECVDEDGDGYCDVCDEEYVVVYKEVELIKKSKAKFQIVVQDGLPGTTVKAIDMLVSSLSKLGVTVNKVADTADTVQDCEILIGNITTRGEKYQKDMHVYGPEGYTVELIDDKIIIVPGSNDAYEEAIEVFKTNFLGIDSSTKKLTNVTVTQENNFTKIQEYRIDKVTLLGNDIRNFTIAADKTVKEEYNTALKVQDLLYTKTGYWLDIVPQAEADKSIVIKLAEKTGGLGFKITAEEDKLSITCEYVTCITDETYNFFNNKIAKAGSTGIAEITAADNTEKNVRDVFYSEERFAGGAKGDGRTDDSEAIRACHEYANRGGHMVYADYNAKYYFGVLKKTIYISTNVDWRDAKFILDDKVMDPSNSYKGVQIFSISSPGTFAVNGLSDWRTSVNENGGISASEFTKIPLKFDHPALLKFSNSDHVNYIRYGVNASDGAAQYEVILVDENGNVDPSTPLMFDYEKITGIAVYQTDLEPITIQGGVFETSPYLATKAQAYTAYGRGIHCARSNVTFKNIKHYLVNEGNYNYNSDTGDYGCPYGGFYNTNVCNNVRYENCVASAHVVYKGSNGAGMGTYDISPGSSTNIVYKNCYQEDANFFNEDGMSRWGVMGSSYCKNITFEDSKLTRFDAHNGVHNVYLIRSTLKMIRIDGTGTFYMEDCTMYSNSFVGLREDYGGYWHGNIILKNTKIITSNANTTLLTNTWYNHYFGYPAAFPTNIIIDGFEIYKDDEGTPYTGTVTLFGSGIISGGQNSVKDYIALSGEKYSDGTDVLIANKNQIPAPERIIIRNSKYEIVLPNVAENPWLQDTVISYNEETECAHHIDIDNNLICDDCKGTFTPCTEHSDINHDGYCTWCNKAVDIPCDKHTDRDRNGKCDTCKDAYTCPGHTDTDSDHICDTCEAPLCNGEHVDVEVKNISLLDGYCDVCYEHITCVDKDNNKVCDDCKKNLEEAN